MHLRCKFGDPRSVTCRDNTHIIILYDDKKPSEVVIAVSGDTRVNGKEQEKMDKYQDPPTEIKRLWKAHRHWHFENNTKRSGGEPENIGNNNKSRIDLDTCTPRTFSPL